MSALKVFNGVYWAILLAWVFFYLLPVLTTEYGANDVRAICARHHGVAQVQDTTFMAGHGKATVVCRDGWVGQIH